MGIETPTISDLQTAFHSKMNAAGFFVDQIKKHYQPESNIVDIPDELYYYVDAAIFELHSASQMLLQIINVKSGACAQANKVSWNRQFKSLLEQKNKSLCDWWVKIDSSPDYCLLESMRQYLSHRGGNFLTAAIRDGKIIMLSMPIRFRYVKGKTESKPTGKSIELLDELVSICHFLNAMYYELQKF